MIDYTDCDLRFDFYVRKKGELTPEKDVQCGHENFSDAIIASCRYIRETGRCPRGWQGQP